MRINSPRWDIRFIIIKYTIQYENRRRFQNMLKMSFLNNHCILDNVTTGLEKLTSSLNCSGELGENLNLKMRMNFITKYKKKSILQVSQYRVYTQKAEKISTPKRILFTFLSLTPLKKKILFTFLSSPS